MALKRFGDTHDVVVTPTISAGAYSALDAVGGLLTFTGLFKEQSAGGINLRMVITDKSKQSKGLALILFNQTFTATADNAAFDPSDADLLNCIGDIEVASGDYQAFADNSMVTGETNISMRSVTVNGTIFGQLYLPADTPTYVSTSDIQVRLIATTDVW